ncbi:hypothetical protein L218DRAFT_876889 [Marasmius fiardii PR-910]|nr:hypothetical protein L218DRAFT_876889 [Marasmius fiardii PR-910]
MWFFGDDSDEAKAYKQVIHAQPEDRLSLELIVAAASYKAVKTYEEYFYRNDQPESHDKVAERLVLMTDEFIEWLCETRGSDYIDVARAKHDGEFV